MPFKYRSEKPKRVEKLSLEERLGLLDDLIRAINSLKSEAEVADFLVSLLTEEEVRVISKRLAVVKALLAGETYEKTVRKLKVSYATVAKLSGWLADRQEFLASLLGRLPRRKETKLWREHSRWDKFKRAHPLYFWPELLAEDWAKSAAKSDRQGLKNVVGQLAAQSSHNREHKEVYAEILRNRPR